MARIPGMQVKLTERDVEACLGNLRVILERGHLIWGEMQERLQAKFSEVTGKDHVLTFNSCTSAYESLFRLMEPRRVAFQGNMFPSPVFAAIREGHGVTWVDIDEQAMAPSVDNLDEAYHREPFEVFVLFESGGFIPRWINDLKGWCDSKGVLFIEDSAQASGSLGPMGAWAGSSGDIAVFSLAATKPLNGGQGGILCLDDPVLAKKLFCMKNYGRDALFAKGVMLDMGSNYHMTEMQAAIALALWETLGERIEERYVFLQQYRVVLESARFYGHWGSGIVPNLCHLPVRLPVQSSASKTKVKSDFLERYDIELGTSIYDIPTPYLGVFQPEVAKTKLHLPGTEAFCRRHFCLPVHNGLTTEDVDYVCQCLRDWGQK